MMNSFKNLIVQQQSSFAEVILNRPNVRNSFNKELIEELKLAFSQLGKKPDVRGIIFKGDGKVFCAGADLEMMKQMVDFSLQENETEAQDMYDMFQIIYQCPKPIITLCHGAAFGGALGLLAVSDIVICEEKTQLCFSEVKLGLVPAVISHFLLKKINPGFLTPLMLTGQVFSASRALQMGLVHEVVVSADMEKTLNSYLELFNQAGPAAVVSTKNLMQFISNAPSELNTELDSKLNSADQNIINQNLADQSQANHNINKKIRLKCSQVIAERRVSSEGQEGLKSFLEKRPCNWKI